MQQKKIWLVASRIYLKKLHLCTLQVSFSNKHFKNVLLCLKWQVIEDQSAFGLLIQGSLSIPKDQKVKKKKRKRDLYIILGFSVPPRGVSSTGKSRHFVFPILICSQTYLMANVEILEKWLNGSKDDRKEQCWNFAWEQPFQ